MNSLPVTPHDARVRVLSDHAALRRSMAEIAVAARAAVSDDRKRPHVRAALAKLYFELEEHLAYDQSVLLPVVSATDADEGVHAAAIVNDHAGQCAVLMGLTKDAVGDKRTSAELMREVAKFRMRFESIMREEEELLLTTEALGEVLPDGDELDE